jgi:radical SAM superfamily enzyme YgiQ (UPF0313 family)
MKILLVEPHLCVKRDWLFKFVCYRSLALEQIAALTPPEHEVEIVEEKFQDVDFSKQYDLVGISCLTSNAHRGYTIADIFRTQGTPVVLGGYHPTTMYHEAKMHADSVVIGEADLVWEPLLRDLQNGKLKPFYKASKLVPADRIPPARRFNLPPQAITPVQATRGCPNQCHFCAMHTIEGARLRPRPIEHVVDEVDSIHSKRMIFVDSSMTINPSYSTALFEAMADSGKRFECFGNINVLARNDKLLQAASEAGCLRWIVGVESISQETLDSMKKGTNKVKDYDAAIKKTKDYGMLVTGLFMFGFDTDTIDVFDTTLQAMSDLDLDTASFSILTPYPGTGVFQDLESSGRILTKDWSLYTEGNLVYQPKQMTCEQLLRGTQEAVMKYYSAGGALRRCLHTGGLPMSVWMNKVARNFLLTRSYNKDLFNIA